MKKEQNNMIASNDLEKVEREAWARLYKNKIMGELLPISYKDKDIADVVDYFRRSPIGVYPYDFVNNYKVEDFLVMKDDSNGLYYYNYSGKKMYLKRKYANKFRAQRHIKHIFIEQDIHSPHRYLTNDFKPDEDSVLIDVGGSEGMMSLDYVDVVKKIFIFENDPDWAEVLKVTFEPWKDKVEIIYKKASDKNDSCNMSIDELVKEKKLSKEKLFIKIDAEGYENSILAGAENTLDEMPNIKIAICAYHKQEAESDIRAVLSDWDIEESEGYMLYYYDYDFKFPYVRKGVLRCTKPTE